MRLGRRIVRGTGCGCLVLVTALACIANFTPAGHTFWVLLKNGKLSNYVASDPNLKYNANEETNLKDLYTALMAYHESEGQWPVAGGWMDAIKNRVSTADLAKGEADKKFVSPSLAGQPGVYGYAMNDLASGKYKGDIKDPKTLLLFDSSDTSRNAHGDPKKLIPKPPRPGGNTGITVGGTIVKL
ncbi:MAG: hypothetical protein P4L46_00600 [Fimbriimonas sp.]|nr:hypothetical protein [Fimbriimonas sp.]